MISHTTANPGAGRAAPPPTAGVSFNPYAVPTFNPSTYPLDRSNRCTTRLPVCTENATCCGVV